MSKQTRKQNLFEYFCRYFTSLEREPSTYVRVARTLKNTLSQRSFLVEEDEGLARWGSVTLTCLHYLFTSHSYCHVEGLK